MACVVCFISLQQKEDVPPEDKMLKFGWSSVSGSMGSDVRYDVSRRRALQQFGIRACVRPVT